MKRSKSKPKHSSKSKPKHSCVKATKWDNSKVRWVALKNNKKGVLGLCEMKKNGQMGPHKHSVTEYYYVLSGNANMRVGNSKQFKAKKGMLIKTPSNVNHISVNKSKKPFVFLYRFVKGPMSSIKYYH